MSHVICWQTLPVLIFGLKNPPLIAWDHATIPRDEGGEKKPDVSSDLAPGTSADCFYSMLVFPAEQADFCWLYGITKLFPYFLG